ncbi:MAG TPA: acylneuraminate cytidylyltransferase family protein [Alphaproteobacteria bacterium]|nr:acylneuraminate cytidylyltransferase family protein [Alphaproteobacteria bacterium]
MVNMVDKLANNSENIAAKAASAYVEINDAIEKIAPAAGSSEISGNFPLSASKKILAIIPARGGSKRLPGKNIMMFHGKPMIAWTIEAAKNSKYIDRVIVSTDDDKIAEVSRRYGAEVPFKRPAELATDTATSVDTIKHAVEFMSKEHGYDPDYICFLQATSPLRTSTDIDNACELMFSRNANACVSVVQTKLDPHYTNTIDDFGFYHNYFTPGGRKYMRTLGNVPKTYLLNGAIYLIKTNVFYEENTFEPPRTVAYEMSEFLSSDIDTYQDFLVAEFFAKNKEVLMAGNSKG